MSPADFFLCLAESCKHSAESLGCNNKDEVLFFFFLGGLKITHNISKMINTLNIASNADC